MNRKQLAAFVTMLVVYAFCIFATYAFFIDQIAASAGIYVVLYGLLGLAGYWFARKLGLPGFIIGDLLFAPINGIGRFPHPPFPVSM
jgi:hypothetical protein